MAIRRSDKMAGLGTPFLAGILACVAGSLPFFAARRRVLR
jgi:hypothetical protein